MSDGFGESSEADAVGSPEVDIRDMTEGDLEEVMAIECTVFPEPWSTNMFRQELHLPLSRNLTARIVGGGIVGYITFWIIAGEVHLHTVAVKRDRQRRGVASALMEAMIRRAQKEGVCHATLEVRPSNERARRLYERFGFTVKGIRPCYYADTKEDALIMWADLEENRGLDNE